MTDDPCFSCPLPDCDDTDQRCGVRKLYRSYSNKVRHGTKELITDAERDANNRIFDSWHLERLAQASEGGRPYKRGGFAYRDGGMSP